MVSSDDQSSSLVIDGFYKYSRNPMLLGFGLYVMGFELFFGSFSTSFLFYFLVVVIVSLWIKLIEEPEFGNRFSRNTSIIERNTFPCSKIKIEKN